MAKPRRHDSSGSTQDEGTVRVGSGGSGGGQQGDHPPKVNPKTPAPKKAPPPKKGR